MQARRGVLQTTTATDDDRRQRPLLVWLFTLCVGGPVINSRAITDLEPHVKSIISQSSSTAKHVLSSIVMELDRSTAKGH